MITFFSQLRFSTVYCSYTESNPRSYQLSNFLHLLIYYLLFSMDVKNWTSSPRNKFFLKSTINILLNIVSGLNYVHWKKSRLADTLHLPRSQLLFSFRRKIYIRKVTCADGLGKNKYSIIFSRVHPYIRCSREFLRYQTFLNCTNV